jgi:hypothetical protein
VLAVLHHDFWWWDDRTLVLGVLPIGLAYHMAFSVAAGLLWWFASYHAWPHDIEEFAAGGAKPAADPQPAGNGEAREWTPNSSR